MKNSDQSAFAAVAIDGNNSHLEAGLTKREYFAGMVLSSICANADRHSQDGDCSTWNYEHLSKISIKAADALLYELEKPV